MTQFRTNKNKKVYPIKSKTGHSRYSQEKRMSKQSKMIDGILGSKRETAKKIMDADSSKDKKSASELIGRRFAINPQAIRKWYEEKY